MMVSLWRYSQIANCFWSLFPLDIDMKHFNAVNGAQTSAQTPIG